MTFSCILIFHIRIAFNEIFVALYTREHMPTVFYIVLNLRTSTGFESFGKFCLGNDRNTAQSIFLKLKGDRKVNDKSILHLDLIETRHELPVNIQMISCSLEELAENCRTITKEMFRHMNLEEI
jgi:hypothetical protein